MNAKRKKAQETIIRIIDKIAPGGLNKKLYEDTFNKMSDKDFDDFMKDVRDEKRTISIVVPVGGDVKISFENNQKVAKEIGYEFFQRLIIKGEKDLPDYKTPNKYLVYKLPIRRASQMLSKKISIPKDIKSINLATGQATGKSAASRITAPELHLLLGMGLGKTSKELLKHRGGDLGSRKALIAGLYKNGKVSQEFMDAYETGVVSTKTLDTYFNSMHIKTTLTK